MRTEMLALFFMACSTSDEAARGPSAALVRVAEVKEGSLTESWTTLGEVVPLHAASLSVGADGPVANVFVREGDAVEAGTLLLALDVSVAQADVAAAVAAVDEAAAELERVERVLARREAVRQGVLAEEELTDARQAVAAQAARLAGRKAARARAVAVLERHRVKAPFAGVVAARMVDAGDWVRPGDPLLSLVSTDATEVRARIPASIASHVEVGLEVKMNGHSGHVVAVVPLLDDATRTALVRVAPDSPMQPGAAVDLAFPIRWEGQGVKVPRDAILADPEQARLVRVVDGKADVVSVEVLATSRTDALVVADGLEPGTPVVVRGNERVRPGQEVRIEE